MAKPNVRWKDDPRTVDAQAVIHGVRLSIVWSTSRSAPGFVPRVDIAAAEAHQIDPVRDRDEAKRAAESMARKVLDAEIARLTKAREALGPEPVKEGSEAR